MCLLFQFCMVLWCGDNEVIGVLNWYFESKVNCDRYFVIYVCLNVMLECVIDWLQLDVVFWLLLLFVGCLDFGDGWYVDIFGDMYFWDVWYLVKDFEYYCIVRLWFCFEFGFQFFLFNVLIEIFIIFED